jgi:hypothetical protein
VFVGGAGDGGAASGGGAPRWNTSGLRNLCGGGAGMSNGSGSGGGGGSSYALPTALSTSFLGATYNGDGSITITAAFGGTPDYTASASGTLVQAVTPASTTVSVSAPTSGVGRTVTFIATVTPAPTAGTVAFSDDGVPIAECATQPVDPVSGTASCDTVYTVVGTHSIVAVFGGAANYQPRTTRGAPRRPSRTLSPPTRR